MTATGPAEALPARSLVELLDPAVLGNPYPLHRTLREESPVYWDPYLHSWVCTRYEDVVTVLSKFDAARTPTPEKLESLGMGTISPIAAVMVRQMLFLDQPAHGRVRALSSGAFSARRIAHLRQRIQEITDRLLDGILERGSLEVMADLANPLPAIVTAEMLGVPGEDHLMLKDWSNDFAEMLGNFQHNPGRVAQVLKSVSEMTEYFAEAVKREKTHPTDGLINTLTTAEVDGDRLSVEDIVANVIVTMVGGQETTTNLIGNGLLTLLRYPEELERLRADPDLMPTAIEELLRFESPSQHTARLAHEDTTLGGKAIKKGQAVVAVMAAANRDPDRFPDPDRLDLARQDNRHLAFGWSAHFCFGAPLARMEGAIALETTLRRIPSMRLATDEVVWRPNLGLRGLTKLEVAVGVTSLSAAKQALLDHRLRGRATGSAPMPIPRVDGSQLPLSAEQEQILLHTLFIPNSTLYNEAVTVIKRGALELGAFRAAFNAFVARHSILSTTFQRAKGAFVQQAEPPVRFDLPLVDLSTLEPAAREEAALALAIEQAQAPYDLRLGPLLRPQLVRMSDDEHRLYLAAHHIIFDGVSLARVLMPELIGLYQAELAGKPSGLVESPLQYGDYASWQRSGVLEGQLAREIPYWRDRLAGAPTLDLPLARPRPHVQEFRGAMVGFEVPAELVGRLGSFAQATGGTVFHAAVAGFGLLLHQLTGQRDVVFATVADLRRRSEFEGLVGYCLTPVIVRVAVPQEIEAGAFLRSVRSELLESLSHLVPVERLVRELNPLPVPGLAPLFQAMIVMEAPADTGDPDWELQQLDARVGTAVGNAKTDLMLELDHRAEGHIAGRVVFNTAIFDAGFGQRVVDEWLRILETFTSP